MGRSVTSVQNSKTNLPRSKWSVKSECCDTPHDTNCEGGTILYSTAISGALSYVRFVAHSKLVRILENNEIQLDILTVSRDISAENSSLTNYGTFDSKEVPFAGISSLHMLGVSSIRSFTLDSETFFLVANYWDGKETRVLSPILRLDGYRVAGYSYYRCKGYAVCTNKWQSTYNCGQFQRRLGHVSLARKE